MNNVSVSLNVAISSFQVLLSGSQAITTCFETSPVGVCDPSDPFFGFDAVIVENAITDFSAIVDGENWNDYYGYWWSDKTSGQLPGYQSVSRYSIDLQENSWFFGNSFFGERSLIMDINQSSNTFGHGSWEQQIAPETSGSPIMTSGTWEAARIVTEPQPSPPEVVPEPSTLPGALIAWGLTYYLKRQRVST